MKTRNEVRIEQLRLKINHLDLAIQNRKAIKIKAFCFGKLPIKLVARGQNYYDVFSTDSSVSDILFEIKLFTSNKLAYPILDSINDIGISYSSNKTSSSSELQVETLIIRSEALLRISKYLQNSQQYIINELNDINEEVKEQYSSLLSQKINAMKHKY